MNHKWMYPWIIAALWFSIVQTKAYVHAPVVNRQVLTYDILSTNITSTTITLSGWALLRYQQHFLNNSTHQIFVEFVSPNHTFVSKATLTPISQTTNMQFRGAPNCGHNQYMQVSSICNYQYENVGFTLSVALDQFHLDKTYVANLVVIANNSNTSAKIPLYFPMSSPYSFTHNQVITTIDSSLNDTALTINASTVVVRSGPGIHFPIVSSGTSCSSTYQNNLFYLQGTTFNKIYDKIVIGTNTYYQLAGSVGPCVDLRKRVVEGNQIYPIWILSNYVEYYGKPLTINKRLVNSPPTLIIQHPTITINQSFNWRYYVQATDKEDGNLTHRIVALSNNVQNKVGQYTVDLMVSDNQHASARGVMHVSVIDAPIYPIIVIPDQLPENIRFDHNPQITYPHQQEDISKNLSTRFIKDSLENLSSNLWQSHINSLSIQLKNRLSIITKRKQ